MAPVILEERGMFLVGASPVIDLKGQVVGCLYGGILLNSNMVLVDPIKDIVFGSESTYANGTDSATIFHRGINHPSFASRPSELVASVILPIAGFRK